MNIDLDNVEFTIGTDKSNDIVVTCKKCSKIQAKIVRQNGVWVLTNLNDSVTIRVNGRPLLIDKALQKWDQISIGSKVINWSNYLYEGDNQELYVEDFIFASGRINRSNYRALLVLLVGLILIIPFLPSLIVWLWITLTTRRGGHVQVDVNEVIFTLKFPVFLIGFSFIGILFILVSIKRMRDTGESLWKLLLPGVNLIILLCKHSYIKLPDTSNNDRRRSKSRN